jgi:hypothetical protein
MGKSWCDLRPPLVVSRRVALSAAGRLPIMAGSGADVGTVAYALLV